MIGLLTIYAMQIAMIFFCVRMIRRLDKAPVIEKPDQLLYYKR